MVNPADCKPKTRIRRKLFFAFTIMLFISLSLTAIAIYAGISFFARSESVRIVVHPALAAELLSNFERFTRALNWISVLLIAATFVTASVVTYFLSNSLTKPIEKLEEFALSIGQGNFVPNDFNFKEKELESLNNALNRSVQQLAIYDNEQKVFFQNVSHELRTPLMSIKCYAEGIMFNVMEPTQACETILKETDKLAELVTDLLYIAKVDNITPAHKKDKIDLTSLIEDSATRQQILAEQKGVSFDFHFSDKPLMFYGTKELISRAVDNLVSNAVRYAKSTISLSCYDTPDSIVINVIDDGDGIEEWAMPHVFERFFKGTKGNTGIGLSIVKSIIDQHNGHIIANNSAQGGAVFTIILPTSIR